MNGACDVEQRLADFLAREQSVLWAYLFGSAARGARYRDIDVALMTSAGARPRLTDLGRLRLRLSAAVGCEVDLIDLRSAGLPLLGSILRERRLLVDRDPKQRHAWEAATASRVLDYEPLIQRYSDLRREKLRLRLSGAG